MSHTPFPAAVERWAALRTAAQWEKKVAELLTVVGVPVFLPLMSRMTTYESKRRTAQVPMFSGYVFCSEQDFIGNPRVTPSAKAKVAQVLRPSDPAKLRAELAEIAELLTDRELIQERVVGGVGTTVRITGGSLAGYHGTIVKVRPQQYRVTVRVSMLGAELEVDVDERMLARAT